MKTHLSLSQRIHNAEGTQAAEYLHARHTYLHATSYCKEEWGEFWDTTEEASWGHLFGVMCGFDEVWYNSVTNYDPDGFRGYINLAKQHPEISWFDARSMREISMHMLGTDIVEAADDGKTVRASFLTPGILVFALNANHKFRGLTLWERYGSDFVYDEDEGEWLYLHEQVCPDMGGPMDVCNPGRDAYNKLMGIGGGKGPGPGPGARRRSGCPRRGRSSPQGQGGAPGAGGGPGGPGGPAVLPSRGTVQCPVWWSRRKAPPAVRPLPAAPRARSMWACPDPSTSTIRRSCTCRTRWHGRSPTRPWIGTIPTASMKRPR